MKKFLLSLMALFALTASAAIDLNDPTTYTSKVYDFVNDAALSGQTLSIGTTEVGTAYETGNAKQQKIYNCTSPDPLVGVFAFQGVAGSKGTRLVSGKGMQNLSATRSAALLGLKEGQIAVFVSTAETNFNGGGTNEGTYTVEKSSDNLTATITMTSDGNLGFCIAKNQYLTKVTIYTEKVAGACTAPEAKITGTSGTSRIITLSDADESAKIYWSETEDGTYTEYTSPVTTAAATIYAYADNGSKSETISFETGAGTLVKLNGVTVSRVGDYSYTVTASQVGVTGNPTANVAYTIGDGAEKTVASGATIDNVNADLKAWAVVDGYTNSDVTEVAFIAPYPKGKQVYSQDMTAYGADNTSLDQSTVETTTLDGIDGNYFATGLNDIYLQQVQTSGNYAWLYRSGKGNSNFKCQYGSAYMVFKDVKAGTVLDIYAGADNNKIPVAGVINGENAVTYNSHYFIQATADGNLAVQFTQGSYIITITEYSNVYAKTVGATGFGTFAAATNVKVPEGVTVYSTTFDSDNMTLTATPVNAAIIPANTGVIVKGEANTEYTYTMTTDEASEIKTALTAAPDGVTGDGSTTYGLLRAEAKFAIIGKGVVLPANYAYLKYTPAAEESKEISFVIAEDAPTAVNAVKAEDKSSSNKKFIKNGNIYIQTAKGTFNAAGAQVK